MRSSRWVVAGAFAAGAAAGLIAGCQVYDFEPVRPIILTQRTIEKNVVARASKPNLMLLVDKSLSMNLPTDPGNSNCPANCGQAGQAQCPATCPTRWTELQGAMSDFLTNNGDVARMGLAVYPNVTSPAYGCGNWDAGAGVAPPAGWDQTARVLSGIVQSSDVAAELQLQADQINSQIQQITATNPVLADRTSGGTPTAFSFQLLGGRSDLQDSTRENFILLLTDGLPNCNPMTAPPDPSSPQCICTSGSCPINLLCLDQTGSVAAAQQNYEPRKIRTIVVGFGTETGTGIGPGVLNAIAANGGFPRKCFADGGGCAVGDTCGANSECTNIKFYQATNRAELAEALAQIGGVLDPKPCEYPLSSDPQDFNPQFLVVYIAEKNQDLVKLTEGPNTYRYSPGSDAGATGYVYLLGDTCTLVSNATPDSPVRVEIRLISTL